MSMKDKDKWFFYSDDYREMRNTNYDWSKHHTRELINMNRSVMVDISSTQSKHGEYVPLIIREVRVIMKEVLATREHIPNSIERKEIRQKKAKAQRNR